VPQLPQAGSLAESQNGPSDSPGQLLSGLGMPARGKGRPHCHNSVQTIWQGRGSRLEQWGQQGPGQCDQQRRQLLQVRCIFHTISYVYIVCIHRPFLAICTYDIVFDVRHCIIPMWLMHIVYDIVGNLRYRIRRRTSHRTYDWQEQSKNLRYCRSKPIKSYILIISYTMS
jgi:hypothetical protein